MDATKGQTERQIKQEIDRLGHSVGGVVSRIDMLLDRLTPALRAEVQEPEVSEKTAPEIELVAFAADIRQVRHTIERQGSLINSALDRLEI